MLGSAFHTYEAVAHMCGRAVYVLYVTLKQAATLLPIVRCYFPHHRSLFIFTICSALRHSFFPYISRHLQVNEYSHWTKSTYRTYNTYSDNITLHTTTMYFFFLFFLLFPTKSLNIHTDTRIRTFSEIGKIHDNKI